MLSSKRAKRPGSRAKGEVKAVSLESRIDKLNQLISRKQTDPVLEAKMKAIQAEFAAMSDEELRAIASGEASEEFAHLSDHELLELIVRES